MWRGRKNLFIVTNRAGKVTEKLGAGHRLAAYEPTHTRDAGLDELTIEGISGHSMRVGAAQDLLNSGASMPIIMQRGRWSKTDTVMRYVENAQMGI